MKLDPTYIAKLILKHISEEPMTIGERKTLDQWLGASEINRKLMEELQDPEEFARLWESFEGLDEERAWQEMVKREPELLSLDYGDAAPKPRGVGLLRAAFRRAWRAVCSELDHRRIVNIVFSSLALTFLIFFLIRPKSSMQNGSPAIVNQPLSLAGRGPRPQLAGGLVLELAEMALGASDTSGGIMATKKDTDLVELRSLPGSNGSQVSLEQVAFNLRNPRGMLFNALLTDSTAVKLNAKSQLVIPACTRSGPSREVTLTGEAYFKVKSIHDKDELANPFVVKVHPHLRRKDGSAGEDTSTMNIICMGTEFNVKAYPQDGYILASLDQGRIRLEIGGHKLTLHAGQSAILDSSGVPRIDDRPVTGSSWKDGILHFSHEPAYATLEELARTYAVQLKYEAGRPARVYGTLNGYRSEPLVNLLDKLSLLAHFKYEIHADTIVVSH